MASVLHENGLFLTKPNQVIINEYLPGQGIGRHVDCAPCFGPQIATLSLGSPCEMHFRNVVTGEVINLTLAVNSLLILNGPSRYDWTHEISARKADNGISRTRRVSVTFRTVNLYK